MNDILLTPIRLSELELLIQNSMRKILLENQSNKNHDEEWKDLNSLIEYLPEHPAASTVYTWVSKNAIPFNKRGKHLYFLKSEIDEWLKSGRKKTIAEIRQEADEFLTSKRRKG